MDVPQLLNPLLRCPNVEIIKTSLPERALMRFLCEEGALAGIFPPGFGKQSASGPLLQNLHDGRRAADFRFGDEQMNMFGHDDVSYDRETISLAHLFENAKEAVAAARSAQERQSAIAGTGDEVQVMRAVGAMQAAGHEKSSRKILWYR